MYKCSWIGICSCVLMMAGTVAILGARTTPVIAGDDNKELDGYLELYQHDVFRGKSLAVRFGTDVPTLDAPEWKFNDETSSIRYVVPDGWECQITEHRDYGGWSLPLRGRGEIPKFEPNDQLTGVRWLKLPESRR
jgi:hypothetical protein